MYPVLFRFGSVTVYSYGFMLSMTFIVGSIFLHKELKRKQMQEELVAPVIMIAVIFGVLGAKLFDGFEYWDKFVNNLSTTPTKILNSGSGLTFLGGFIVAFIAICIYLKIKKIPLKAFADATAPSLMIGYGIARIGCQLAGDGDYGVPTTFFLGMQYPNGTVPTLEYVHPTPVYEALAAFILFFVLWRLRLKQFPHGVLFSYYLIFSGIERFLVEFIRINPNWLLGLSQSQIISVLLFIVGIFGIIGLNQKDEGGKKTN